VGIDPGLVHTGIVVLRILTDQHALGVQYSVVDGDDVATTAGQVKLMAPDRPDRITIEQYIQRGTSFRTAGPMQRFEVLLKQAIPGAELRDNRGAKKIVKRELMQLLGLWKFPTTNHQDLQAAARILLFDAIKDKDLNRVIYTIARDHQDGTPWSIIKQGGTP